MDDDESVWMVDESVWRMMMAITMIHHRHPTRSIETLPISPDDLRCRYRRIQGLWVKRGGGGGVGGGGGPGRRVKQEERHVKRTYIWTWFE